MLYLEFLNSTHFCADLALSSFWRLKTPLLLRLLPEDARQLRVQAAGGPAASGPRGLWAPRAARRLLLPPPPRPRICVRAFPAVRHVPFCFLLFKLPYPAVSLKWRRPEGRPAARRADSDVAPRASVAIHARPRRRATRAPPARPPTGRRGGQDASAQLMGNENLEDRGSRRARGGKLV